MIAVKVKVEVINVDLSDHRIAYVSRDVAKELDLAAGGRVKIIASEGKVTTAFVAVDSSLSGAVIAVPSSFHTILGSPEELELKPYIIPSSVNYIRRKLEGEKLTKDEIYEIIRDVVDGVLTDVEIAAFVSAQMSVGMDIDEMVNLTRAMVDTGNKLQFEEPVYDIHSIGGVPGNSKVSIVAVPTIASAGILIPKTSSRAITSPAGTADTMEVFAPVNFTVEEVKELLKRIKGFIIWGGTLGLAPADDILIRVEYVLRVDPLSQMIASILSKKLSMGVQNLLIDIPVGREAKVDNIEEGRKLASIFTQVGQGLGINMTCAITYGGQPIGYTIGPALEAREALETLLGKGPMSVREKATAIAGIVYEMAGVAPRGAGKKLAKEALASGRSYEEFKKIVEAMGGNPNVKLEDIPIGSHKVVIKAPIEGYITGVYNKPLTTIARAAGAPVDKGAGIRLHVKRGHKVKEGDVLLEIYSNSEARLEEAVKLLSKVSPITIEGMVLETYPPYIE